MLGLVRVAAVEAPRRRPRPTTWALVAAAILAFMSSVPASGAGTTSLRAPDLETSLAVAVDRYNELDRRTQELAAAGARTERKVRSLAREMLALENEARRSAIALYKAGTTAAVEGLLEMDLAEMEETISYLESSSRSRLAVFQHLAARRGRLELVLDRLETAREAADEARAEMALVQADIRERLEDARAEKTVVQEATRIATAEPPAAPSVPGPPYNADWDAIAMCESGGNWHLDSTYDGGLQFHPMTWLGHGGGQYARYAWQASREEQIAIAEKVLASQGPGAWGSCYQE